MASPNPLRHTDSQDTVASMLQLDPQPIDPEKDDLSTLDEGTMESSTSTIKSLPTASSLGLSGSGHGAIYYLTRVQRYSSYTFTFFTGLHLANTSLIPLVYQSVPYSEPFLLMAREIYQTPLTEPLLVGLPVAAHIASGLALRLLRRQQNVRRYGGRDKNSKEIYSSSTRSSNSNPWPRLSAISASGYVFTVLLASHVGMNRVLPLVKEGDSSNIGLQYVAHGFARKGLPPWVAYSLLLSVGVGHMVWGWAKWYGVAPPTPDWSRTEVDKNLRRRRRRAYWSIQGVAVALTGLWAAGGLGIVARGGPAYGWLGTVYDGIFGALPTA